MRSLIPIKHKKISIMKTFFKKFANWLGISKLAFIDYSLRTLMIVLMLMPIFVELDSPLHNSWYGFLFDRQIIFSIIAGSWIIFSSYCLITNKYKEYENKRYIPFFILIVSIFLLIVTWTYFESEESMRKRYEEITQPKEISDSEATTF